MCAEASGQSELRDWPIFEEKDQGVQTRHALEKQLEVFFRGLVSEWNPIRDDAGRWRYRWDAEVGAHDVEAVLGEDLTSEGKAVRDVPATAPEVVNLRSLLDRVYSDAECSAPVDVQRIRRLVAMLVQRVGRHTMHGAVSYTHLTLPTKA